MTDGSHSRQFSSGGGYSMVALLTLVVLFVGAVVPTVDAQTGLGAIEGAVRDESGAVVPGVTVTATHAASGASASAVSDGAGRFEVGQLPPGDYELSASMPGFGPATSRVSVVAGAAETVEFTLAISPLAESVTVTRTLQERSVVPTAVAVIDGDEVQFAQRQEALAETMRGVPGVFAENRRNFSLASGTQVTIRAPMVGFGMRGIQMFQDGIPLTTADGTTQPTNLDLGSAERLEIIRGPNSVLYGNAAGGVISVWTAFPTARRLEVQPDIQFGSYGYNRQQVKVHGTSGQTSYLFNANRIETDGFREHSAAEVRRANLVVRRALSSKTEIRGMFNFFDMPFGESASTLNEDDARNNPQSVRALALPQGWGEAATQGQGGVTLEHQFENGMAFRGTGWGAWRDVSSSIPFRTIDLGRNSGGFRTELSGANNSGAVPVRWTTGVDLSVQSDDRAEFGNAGGATGGGLPEYGDMQLEQKEEVFSVAPFAQVTLTLHPRWFATAGVRYDYYDFTATDRFLSDGDQSGGRTLDAVSPMAGVTFAASDEVNIYSNFSTAYQTPTTVELSNQPTGEGEGGFNENLNPEDLRSFEVGARGTANEGRVSYVLAAYFATLDNAFVEFQRPDEQTFFLNAGKSSRNGLEARVDWAPTPQVSTYVSYTYQNFEFVEFETGGDDFSGNAEPGAPPHQLYVGGAYETPFGLCSIAQFRWVDAYAVNNTAENWSYAVMDLRFGWDGEVNGVTIQPFFGVDNLFDERYNGSSIPNSFGRRYYEPSPGREVYVGFRIGGGIQ